MPEGAAHCFGLSYERGTPVRVAVGVWGPLRRGRDAGGRGTLCWVKAQGPSRTCNESKEEKEEFGVCVAPRLGCRRARHTVVELYSQR